MCSTSLVEHDGVVTVAVALVIERDYFLTQGTIEVFAVARVVNIHIGMRSAGSNRKAVQTIVSLGPPAI